MGTLKIMDRTGHTELKYELEDKKAVVSAETTYKQKMAQGYAPFLQLEDGSYARVQNERFDARETYLLLPQMVGG